MSVSITRRGRLLNRSGGRSGRQASGGWVLFGLLIGAALPAVGQEQPFAKIDDEILHLTPVNRQLDYVTFLPSMGALKPMHAQRELFTFDNVLLPAATWMDDDPDNSGKRHLETADDIRHSVVPQINPRGTLSLVLHGNGETALDSDQGQAGFRSNGPVLSENSNSDMEIPVSGSWTAIPVVLTLSRLLAWSRRRRRSCQDA